MEVKKEITSLLNYAYRYLGYRMRTEYEMRIYLTQKASKRNISEEFVDETISKLKEEGHLNDVLFVEEFVRSRINSKPKSAYALSRELQQKGVKRDLINEYFSSNKLDEEKLASAILTKKWHVIAALKKEVRFKKANNLLRNRGFGYDIIKKTIEQLESSE